MPATTKSVLRLSVLGPLVICSGLTIDVALRFLNVKYFSFRAHDYATLFATAEGPFAPNFSYDNPRAYGDLANLGNLRKDRIYRREIFHTDANGYRVTPADPAKPLSLLLVGDSFAGGANLSDGDTLTAQLSSQGNFRAFNGAGVMATWPGTARLIQRVGMKKGLVLWQVSERHELPLSILREEERMGRLRPVRDFATRIRLYSPLSILAKSGFDLLTNDVILPNTAAGIVGRRTLTNGQTMLFLGEDIANFSKVRRAEAGPFVELQGLVRATGNELQVVLVPGKYTAYQGMIEHSQAVTLQADPFLSRAARKLEAAGVPVLNLTPALQEEAARAYQRGEYCYSLDDTHWNPLGTKRAAREILRQPLVRAISPLP